MTHPTTLDGILVEWGDLDHHLRRTAHYGGVQVLADGAGAVVQRA